MGSTPRLYEQFLGFYGNPAIGTLADAARWTVSGRLGDPGGTGKVPIDMRALLDIGRVRGAWTIGEECLVTLRELTERLPDAANHAFYLRAQTDGLMVVDIEPDCPAEIAANLLGLPGLIYTETSMSGRGYHLMTALPENFYDHAVASSKRVLREEHGWYELLLDHWVTFTRRPVAKSGVAARAIDIASAPFASLEEVYASLASKASSSACVMGVPTGVECREIKGGQQIVERTLEAARPRLKRLDDFADDHSRWEFSIPRNPLPRDASALGRRRLLAPHDILGGRPSLAALPSGTPGRPQPCEAPPEPERQAIPPRPCGGNGRRKRLITPRQRDRREGNDMFRSDEETLYYSQRIPGYLSSAVAVGACSP